MLLTVLTLDVELWKLVLFNMVIFLYYHMQLSLIILMAPRFHFMDVFFEEHLFIDFSTKNIVTMRTSLCMHIWRLLLIPPDWKQ